MLVIHIGSQKTGTTAIQGFLTVNKAKLAEKGVSYISAGRKHIAHNPIVRPLINGTGLDFLTDIRAEILSTPAPVQVLSSEMFFQAQIAPILGDALADINREVKIVAYIRRPDSYAEAMYKQKVKNGRIDPDPMAFLKKWGRNLNYKEILDAYSNAFGEGSVSVRPFERDRLKGGDVVDDFMDQLGVEMTDDFMRPDATSNKTLSRAVSEQLGLVNRHTSFNTKVMIREIVRAGVPETIHSNDVYDLATRREIFDSVREELASIAKDYACGPENLFGDDDLSVDAVDKYPSAEVLLRLERAASQAILAAVGRQHKDLMKA